ncbi:MAG: hypothetical protein ACC645_15705 [Pirellulales bacterium]
MRETLLTIYDVAISVVRIAWELLILPLRIALFYLWPINGWRYVQQRRAHREWKRLRRCYRPFVFEPWPVDSLADEARAFFGQHTPEFLELGFKDLGTYLLKGQPPQIGRLFQNESGDTIGVLMHFLDGCSFDFNTILENGRNIETTSVSVAASIMRINESDRYRAASAPGLSVEETYQSHRRLIAEMELYDGTRRLAFRREQIQDILTYQHACYCEIMSQLGDVDPPPKLAICPEGRPLEPDTDLLPSVVHC